MSQTMQAYLIMFALAVCGFLLCLALCRQFISMIVIPNRVENRSSHTKPTPRSGGIAILGSFIIVACLYGLISPSVIDGVGLVALVGLTGFMALIGVIDDIATMSPAVKFLGQLTAAIALVAFAGPIETLPLPVMGETQLGLAGLVISVIWVVAFVNAFNFMDGLNGMAAGTALVALIAMCILSAAAGQYPVFVLCLMMTFCVTGFFLFNFPRGDIFMGDAGSLGLGFFLAAIAMAASTPSAEGQTSVPVIILPVIFLPFLLDVTLTILKRAMHGEKIYEAHKQHFYQRLHQAGWSHGDVTRLYMLAAVVSAVSGWGISLLPGPVQWMGLFLLAVILLVSARVIAGKVFGEETTVSTDVAENPGAAE